MKAEYVALRQMEQSSGWKVLNDLWIYQISKIEEGRDKAAAKGSETAWRYWAGQEKGFKLAMTALARAIVEMESKDGDEEDTTDAQKRIDELLDQVRPK